MLAFTERPARYHQIREFRLGKQGIDLLPAYLGPDGVLTGSARVAQEARERTVEQIRLRDLKEKKRALERRRKVLEAQMLALQAELETEDQALSRLSEEDRQRSGQVDRDRQEMARSRRSDAGGPGGNGHASGEAEPQSMESRDAS